MVERERDAYHSDNGCKGEEIHFLPLVLANMEGGAELKWRQSSLPVYFPEVAASSDAHSSCHRPA